jgi:hypothetical protein
MGFGRVFVWLGVIAIGSLTMAVRWIWVATQFEDPTAIVRGWWAILVGFICIGSIVALWIKP